MLTHESRVMDIQDSKRLGVVLNYSPASTSDIFGMDFIIKDLPTNSVYPQ